MSSSGVTPSLTVLNASNRKLRKVSQISCPGSTYGVAVLNMDDNTLSTLTGVECYPALIQLSACNNNLVRMNAIQFLGNLVTVNLQGNSITRIAGLEELVRIQWISLAGNSITSMRGLSSCIELNHLDLSENCITELSDISTLHRLKTLLLHGNAITSFQSVPQCLPKSLVTLSLAENEVSDLNEVSFLQSLLHLEQLSLLSNPCVSITQSRIFDYRPYILYWCPLLTVLDGMEVTSGEKQSSLMLFPPGKPYPFSLGEHSILIHYLTSTHPLNAPLSSSTVTDCLTNVPITDASLSELESLLSNMDQTGITEKMKALQLVEEMIASQEHLMASRRDDSTDVMAESAISNEQVVTVAAESGCPRGFNAESPFHEHSSNDGEGSKTDSSFVSQVGSKELQSRKEQQLKIINEKLAKRKSLWDSKRSVSSPFVIGKGTAGTITADLAKNSKRRKETKIVARGSYTHEGSPNPNTIPQPPFTTQDPLPISRDLDISSPIVRVRHRPDDPLPTAKVYYPLDDPLPTPKVHHLQRSDSLPTSRVHHTSGVRGDPLPTYKELEQEADPLPTAETSSDMLDSESTFFPVLPSDGSQSEDRTLPDGDKLENQDTEFYVNSLLSSLNSAYGYSSLAEKSRLLSSLALHEEESSVRESNITMPLNINESDEGDGAHDSASTEKLESDFSKAAVIIQSAYRGYVSRRNLNAYLHEARAASLIQATWRGFISRRRDPQVRMVQSELSRIKLESYVTTLHRDLESCKQTLAQQSQEAREHKATIMTLLQEVRSLQLWRDNVDMLKHEKAAIVLQKNWRGYRIRKNSPLNGQPISKTQALWKLCNALQNEVNQVQQKLAHLEDKNLGTRNRESSQDLPSVKELQMTHHSDMCVLLRWTPPLTLLTLSSKRLCYRIYVNGVPEGMVGPDKLKAYIEGLEKGTTYRITVRVVYDSGESGDSNPVIASLDSNPQCVDRGIGGGGGGGMPKSNGNYQSVPDSSGGGGGGGGGGTEIQGSGNNPSSVSFQTPTQINAATLPGGEEDSSHLISGRDGSSNPLSDKESGNGGIGTSHHLGSPHPGVGHVLKAAHITHNYPITSSPQSISSESQSPPDSIVSDFGNLKLLDPKSLFNNEQETSLSVVSNLVSEGVPDLVAASPLEPKGDSEVYGYTKPSTIHPTLDNALTNPTSRFTMTSWSNSYQNPSVHTVAHDSPHPQRGDGLVVARSPLISHEISTPSLTGGSDVSSALGMQYKLSTGFDDPLVLQTKQPSPFTSPPNLCGVLTTQKGQQQLLSSDSTLLVGESMVVLDTLPSDNGRGTHGQQGGVLDTSIDSVAVKVTDSNREEAKMRGNEATTDAPPPPPGNQIPLNPAVQETGASLPIPKKPEWKSYSCDLKRRRERANPSLRHHQHTDGSSENCFDSNPVTNTLPNEVIDSLVDTTATPLVVTDNTVMKLATEQRAPLKARIQPFISKESSGTCQQVGGGGGEEDLLGSSAHAATVLLMKLESDLTNSLKTD